MKKTNMRIAAAGAFCFVAVYTPRLEAAVDFDAGRGIAPREALETARAIEVAGDGRIRHAQERVTNYDPEGCGGERRITDARARRNSPSGYYYPKFLKDGSEVVFTGLYSSNGKNFRYATVGLNGGEQKFYAESEKWSDTYWSSQFYAADPNIRSEDTCSPDFCVSTDPRNQSVLRVIRRATGEAVHVSIGSGGHRVPAITPDGRKIIFAYNSAGRDDAFSLMISNLDGSDARVLVEGEALRHHNWNPTVSPDGKFVAYSKGGANGESYFPSDIYLKCLR